MDCPTQVLKDVKFPVMLDMYDMCGTELKVKILLNLFFLPWVTIFNILNPQEKIKPRRTEFKEYEDWLVI